MSHSEPEKALVTTHIFPEGVMWIGPTQPPALTVANTVLPEGASSKMGSVAAEYEVASKIRSKNGFGFGGLEHTPVVGPQVPAVWHASGVGQVTGFDPAHAPAWHASVWVQALPSLHGVPLAAGGLEHCPVPGSQAPGTWQGSAAVQVTGSDPVHVPLVHASLRVHPLPSLQAEPFGFAGSEHAPVVGSQTPGAWHWSSALQATGAPGLQVPVLHVSDVVQPLPSSHAEPSAFAGFEHCPVAASQVPAAWHGSGSGHTTGFDPVQPPAWHVSVSVQLLPSSHAAPFGLLGFEQTPVAGSHAPAVWH
jgi:hypothetical protein